MIELDFFVISDHYYWCTQHEITFHVVKVGTAKHLIHDSFLIA